MEIRIYTDSNGKAPFTEWINARKDMKVRAIIRAKLVRLEGNFGYFKPLRSERIMKAQRDKSYDDELLQVLFHHSDMTKPLTPSADLAAKPAFATSFAVVEQDGEALNQAAARLTSTVAV